MALVSFTGHGEELINGLKDVVEGFGKFFKGVFTGDLKLAAEGAKQIWAGLKQAWNAIVNSIKDAWNAFVEWLRSKTRRLQTSLKRLENCSEISTSRGRRSLAGLSRSFPAYLPAIGKGVEWRS